MVNQEEIIHDVVALMKRHYGERLDEVILYGSYARGDFHDESDMDFLVVLGDEEMDQSQEISNLTEAVSELTDKHKMWISVKPTTNAKLKDEGLLFYRRIKKEGIPLYERRTQPVH